MNKTAIKNFAIWARNKLIVDISYRAGLMGITKDGIHSALPQSTGKTEFYDIGTAEPYAITGEAIRQRRHLVELIQRKEADTDYKTAYKYIIEEVAYAWFNRLIAVRFMEVNDYLPSHIRVLSSDSGKLEPDLVTTPFDAELEFTTEEQQAILDLKNANKMDEVFRLLFIKQCNALNEILPALFEKSNDYTELLQNLSVIDQDGVVYHLVHDIPEEDFDVERGGQVEIIGWLYQYYNTEPKNEAFAKKGKITKEEIPAVTQLFTPDWIVRYMVENSVGRLWIEHLRALDESVDEATLAASFGWKYYLPETKQEPAVEAELRKLRRERASLTPEQITIIDPCMGSGHILVYAFEVLMQIYGNTGYGQRDAAKSILENNLFGLDIDDRAYQIAYFAVMMKARGYNRRILNGENECKVYAIQDSNGITDFALEEMGTNLSNEDCKKARNEAKSLIVKFKDAKEYGSILNIDKYDWDLLRQFAVSYVGPGQLTLDLNGVEIAAERFQKIIDIAEVLANKYMVMVTNPPYMGGSKMNGKLAGFVKKYYPDSKSDLFSVFIERSFNMLVPNGFDAMITMEGWMFLSSFEKMRSSINQSRTIQSLIHMPYLGKGRTSLGINFGTATFIIKQQRVNNYKAVFDYIRYFETDDAGVPYAFPTINERYKAPNTSDFMKIPSAPVAYWFSDHVFSLFEKEQSFGTVAETKSGLSTTDNARFLRTWEEVNYESIGFNYSTLKETHDCKHRYIPHQKGGEFRKWYGNLDYVVDWFDNGAAIKKAAEGATGGRIVGSEYYLRKGLTWTDLTSTGKISVRYADAGSIFNSSGPMCFCKNEEMQHIVLGYMNSSVAKELLRLLAPTFHFNGGPISKLPFIYPAEQEETINNIVKENVDISRLDWDMFEHSWNFKRHPLVRDIGCLEDIYSLWKTECHHRFIKLKNNEETLNHLFAHIYGMENEIDCTVADEDVTIRTANLVREIKSLISYAVGCMFGRYSLDIDGLAYGGGSWDASKYSSFLPDADNVIPITDEEYMEDDIVTRFCSWLKKVYGEYFLEKNLDFIAKALGNKGNSSREIVRNYFLNEFFKDHCQYYSVTGSGKRPIYWLFDSGKQNGFKALVYLHRYNADTIGNLRIDYLHRMQHIYENEMDRMQDMIDNSTNVREVGQATKRRDKLTKQLKECREYDEKLAHLALSRIELNLDDGVKVNYRKVQTANDGRFYEVLADSKNIMANNKIWKQYTEGRW